ncbi:MAG: acyl-CoA dehydrogenase family protein [Chakrabartia sp.]
MTDIDLLDPFRRLLADACPSAVVRAIDAGGSGEALWREMQGSGYLDALVAESAGGAGLGLADVGPLLCALGAQAMPLPLGETMIARALIAATGGALPEGPIVLIPADSRWPILSGAQARWALVEEDARLLLRAITNAVPMGDAGALAVRLELASEGTDIGPASASGLRPLLAVLRACQISGAAERLLEMTVAYANDRIQFGKPIGKLQAVQQQLAVMAEQVIAARFAAQTGCAAGLPPSEQAAATAKQVASTAAAEIAAIAHAVHGAIGISAEYDLQLLTRRLHAWRLAEGSESYWARRLGALRFAHNGPSVDFIRA